MFLPSSLLLLLSSLVLFLPVESYYHRHRGSPSAAIEGGPPLGLWEPGGSDDDDGAAPSVYIVHVRKPEHLLSANREEVEEWHKSFLPTPTLDSGRPRLLASFHVVISGFAALLTAEDVRAMSAKKGFVHARTENVLLPQTTRSPDFLGLRPDVWQRAGRGEDAIIAVVDSGIRHDHDSFAGSEMPNPPPAWHGWCYFDNKRVCNDKLIGAAMFDVASQVVVQPDDDGGHGTHVAATAAGLEVAGASIRGGAAGTAAGAAPGAYLSVYKATGGGSMLWSVEQAIEDGSDVISVSMGVSPPPAHKEQPPLYTSDIAIASLAAVRHGILASCAACNNGPRPSTVCNDAPWIMTVGASTLDRALRLNVRFGDPPAQGEIAGESVYDGPVIRAGLVFPALISNKPAVWSCLDLDGIDVAGKVVMCDPGREKEAAAVVREAGGVAIIAMNVDRMGSIIVHIAALSFPTVAINSEDAHRLIDYVNGTHHPCPPHVELVPVGTITGVPSSPAVPYFSGRGPSLRIGGILKPDILGPGVNILAADYNSTAGYVLDSGTSMAAPHLSGIAAIVKFYQTRETGMEWSPAMVRSALMTTAQLKNREGGDILDQANNKADLFATGAGHVNPDGALDPGFVYDIQFDDYVRYLCGLGYTDMEVLRTAAVDIKCDDFGKVEPEQLNYPTISVTMSSSMKRKVVRRTGTNVRSRQTAYKAEVSFPAHSGVVVTVSPDTLRFVDMGETQSFDVTFALVDGAPVAPKDVFQGLLKWVPDSVAPAVSSPLLVTIGCG